METPLVMSIIGPDRPGLVDLVASAVRGAGGNWLESRMCHLGGQFAGILRVSLPADQRDRFFASIAEVESQGLFVTVCDDAPTVGECQEVALVEIVGNDRPGIVSQISRAFAKRGVNVEELETSCRGAPMTGAPLFEARARVCLPAGCDRDDLRRELESIAADMMIDVSFEPA